jgi:hypothetical protein
VDAAQAPDRLAAVPELAPLQRQRGGQDRPLGPRHLLVAPPGPGAEVPEQPDQGGGHQGGQGDPPSRLVPEPLAQEPQEDLAVRAGRAGRGALPGGQVHGHPGDAEDQGEGEAEGEQTQDRLEQAPPPVAGRQLPRLHEVADVDQGERQQQQPQHPQRRARGEPAPGVRLQPVRPGRGQAVGVAAAVEPGLVVAGAAPDVRMVQHRLGRRAAHPVHPQLDGPLHHQVADSMIIAADRTTTLERGGSPCATWRPT